MRWLKRKLRNWISEDDICISNKVMATESIEHLSDPIRFAVTPARGGIVVTTRTYDRVKDRHNDVVHVIHDDEDVARKVGDIVAMELMKA